MVTPASGGAKIQKSSTELADKSRDIEVWLTAVPIVAAGGLVEPYPMLLASEDYPEGSKTHHGTGSGDLSVRALSEQGGGANGGRSDRLGKHGDWCNTDDKRRRTGRKESNT